MNIISNSFIHFLSLVTKTTTHDTNKAHIAAGYCMTFISDKCDNINIYAKSNMVLETQQMDFCIIEFTCHDCLNLFFELSSCQRSVGVGGLKQPCVIYYWSGVGIFWDADQTRRQKHQLETHFKNILCRLYARRDFFVRGFTFFWDLHLFKEFEDCFMVTGQSR